MGAEDAWYMYGFYLENVKLRGEQSTGGFTDIFKCFDDLQRDFLIELCRLGGFPPGPLLAYRSFHASCRYYNTIAGGLGDAHDHPCGIPQGCPLSMMILPSSPMGQWCAGPGCGAALRC